MNKYLEKIAKNDAVKSTLKGAAIGTGIAGIGNQAFKAIVNPGAQHRVQGVLGKTLGIGALAGGMLGLARSVDNAKK